MHPIYVYVSLSIKIVIFLIQKLSLLAAFIANFIAEM